MRRNLAALLMVTAWSSSAYAVDHLAVVNEVSLAPQQFIEIDDGLSSPFPSVPYRIVVRDGAGTTVGMVDVTAIGNQTGGDRYFVVGGPGYTGPADTPAATFAFNLPASGTACFKRANGTSIHCYGWGTVTATAGETVVMGPAPGSGQSAQRQAGGVYAVGTPTPNAVNAVIAASMDGGLPPDAAAGTPDSGSPITPIDSGEDGCACAVGGGFPVTRGLAALSLLLAGFWLMRRKR